MVPPCTSLPTVADLLNQLPMLRITSVPVSENATVLKLEGKLLGPWIGELNAASLKADLENRPVILDLSSLSFVDTQGIATLHELRKRGYQFEGCSALVIRLLQGE
jgi:anti-anti-sigma regulatory factor